MSGERIRGVSYEPGEAAPLAAVLDGIPPDAPIERELFAVMAILLAQVLDSDEFRTNGSLHR